LWEFQLIYFNGWCYKWSQCHLSCPLYTRSERPWRAKFQPMEGLKIEKTKECHFTPKTFSPRDGKKKKWCGEHFCPLWQRKCTIFESPRIFVKPTFKGRFDANSRGPVGQNSHRQSIFIFKDHFRITRCAILENILKNSIVHFVAPSHFSLHITSKGHQVERAVFQGWAMAFERFSPWLLISSVKGASYSWICTLCFCSHQASLACSPISPPTLTILNTSSIYGPILNATIPTTCFVQYYTVTSTFNAF
jgi:hypothetical protein